jgi:Spy/CpxP family protein refolding chaperone
MERGVRTKAVTALVLAAVFCSGLLLGYAADTRLLSETPSAAGQPAVGDRQGGERPETRQRRPLVYEQLNPTPAQTAVIDSIMHVQRQRMNALDKEYRDVREQYDGRYNALVQETREAIADVFPPEVAEEYRRLLAEFDRLREAERAAAEGARN